MKFGKIFIKALVYLVVVLAVMVTTAITQTPQKEQLLNGLKVLMWPDSKADKVWVRIRIHAGSAFDPQGKEGVMQLLADNLFPGNIPLDQTCTLPIFGLVPAAEQHTTDDPA